MYLLFVVGALLLVLLLVISLVGALFVLPEGARYSDNQTIFLFSVGFAAAVGALVLLTAHGDAWWVIPVGVFLAALLGTKAVAVDQRDRKLEEQRRQLAERQKRVEERNQRERARAERLGKDGVKTMARMKAAIKSISETEAAREGWLGDAGDISFKADVRLTEEQLARIVTFRTKIDESKRLPHPTVADKEMVKEAQAAMKKLEIAVRERINVIEGCVRKAQEVDETLRTQRQRAETAEQRDALRGQLAAMIAGVELTPANSPSDSVDAVTARADAFRELKDSIEPRARELDGASDETSTNSSWMSAVGRLWPW